jgi:hypothetical protein
MAFPGSNSHDWTFEVASFSSRGNDRGRPLVHVIRRQLAQLPDTKARNYLVIREAGQRREMPGVPATPSSANVRQSRFAAWGAITQLVTRRSGAQKWLARWSLSRGIAQIAVGCACGRFAIGPDRYAAARHRARCAGLPGGQPRQRPARGSAASDQQRTNGLLSMNQTCSELVLTSEAVYTNT